MFPTDLDSLPVAIGTASQDGPSTMCLCPGPALHARMEAALGMPAPGPVRADAEPTQAARPGPSTHDSLWGLWAVHLQVPRGRSPSLTQQMRNSCLLLIIPTPGPSQGRFFRTLQGSELSARGCLGHEATWLSTIPGAAPGKTPQLLLALE